MRDFTTNLKLEVDQNIRSIESGEHNILNRVAKAAKMLEDKLNQLKTFISEYTFADDEEEIQFFREIKPPIYCLLLFYQKVYNIEMNRPMGTVEAEIDYLNSKLDHIREYAANHLDFYRYVRSGATHLDRDYYLHGESGGDSQYLEYFSFERDLSFTTIGDFRLSTMMANEMLQNFIKEELELVGRERHILNTGSLATTNFPRWTDKKNGLIEILYAFHEMGCIDNGNLSLNRLASHFEFAFDIKLGNVTRAFHEMKFRNNPTSFLDEMRKALLRRLDNNESRNSYYRLGNRPSR